MFEIKPRENQHLEVNLFELTRKNLTSIKFLAYTHWNVFKLIQWYTKNQSFVAGHVRFYPYLPRTSEKAQNTGNHRAYGEKPTSRQKFLGFHIFYGDFLYFPIFCYIFLFFLFCTCFVLKNYGVFVLSGFLQRGVPSGMRSVGMRQGWVMKKSLKKHITPRTG